VPLRPAPCAQVNRKLGVRAVDVQARADRNGGERALQEKVGSTVEAEIAEVDSRHLHRHVLAVRSSQESSVPNASTARFKGP
jgi:hypothetical protein